MTYTGYLMLLEMGWQLHYAYALNPAQTQLQYGDTVTVCGTYSAFPGLWGYPEIEPEFIYMGGSTYGAMSVGDSGSMNTASLASVAQNETPEHGGGTFKPWPYPTSEEILASPAFQAAYNQPGNIGWVLSQPDGSIIDVSTEATCGQWYDGRVFGLREWFEPIPNGSRLFLYLNNPVQVDGLARDVTIDIVGATLTTLSNGQRALVRPAAVYAYTDENGRFTPPLPWLKYQQPTTCSRTNSLLESSVEDAWPWKLKVAP